MGNSNLRLVPTSFLPNYLPKEFRSSSWRIKLLQQAAVEGSYGYRAAFEVVGGWVGEGFGFGVVVELLGVVLVVGVVDLVVGVAGLGVVGGGVDYYYVVHLQAGEAVGPDDGGGVEAEVVVDFAVEAVL